MSFVSNVPALLLQMNMSAPGWADIPLEVKYLCGADPVCVQY